MYIFSLTQLVKSPDAVCIPLQEICSSQPSVALVSSKNDQIDQIQSFMAEGCQITSPELRDVVSHLIFGEILSCSPRTVLICRLVCSQWADMISLPSATFRRGSSGSHWHNFLQVCLRSRGAILMDTPIESDFDHDDCVESLASLRKLDFRFRSTVGSSDWISVLSSIISSQNLLVELALSQSRFAWSLDIAHKFSSALRVNSSVSIVHLDKMYLESHIFDSMAPGLFSISGLQRLNLAHNLLADSSWNALCDFLLTNTNLKFLDVSGNSFSPDSAAAFARVLQLNSSLTDLSLQSCLSEDTVRIVAEGFSKNRGLQTLDLSVNATLSDEGVLVLAPAVASCSSLTSLSMHNSKLSWGGTYILDALAPSSTLRSLNLAYNRLYDQPFAFSLVDFLNTNTTLTELDVSANDLGNRAVVMVSDVLSRNTWLRKLRWANTATNNDGALALVQLFQINNYITYFDFSMHQLAPSTFVSLAHSLAVNGSLRYLDLSYIEMNVIKSQAICTLMKLSTSIVSLNLANNALDDAGVLHVAEGLKTNTSIRSLNLSSNMISDIGATSLAEVLQTRNSTLVDLNLNGNPFDVAGAVALAKCASENPNLESISMLLTVPGIWTAARAAAIRAIDSRKVLY